MDKILEVAQQIKQEIDSYPEIQEFLKNKELFENSNELKALRKEIAIAKENKSDNYDDLVVKYNSHPLVVNFEESKKEAYSILNIVKEAIK